MQFCKDVEERVEETRHDFVETWQQVEQTVQETICEWLPWPLDSFCDLITHIIFVVVLVIVEVITIIVKIITKVVCVTLEITGVIIDAVVGFILRIPVIGRFIGQIIKLVSGIISLIVGILDGIAYLIGIRPIKYLRLGILILRDEQKNPVIQLQDVNAALAFAQTVYYDEAHVRIKLLGVEIVDGVAPRENLDAGSEQFAYLDDIWLAGGWFDLVAQSHFRSEGLSRVLAVGSPVIVFITRSVRGKATGSSLWMLTDYVTVEGSRFVGNTADETVMAHEMGHACTLLHTDDKTNLMDGSSSPPNAKRGGNLSPFQAVVVRASRHVTFW
ncbi:MAG: hypothetical protein ABI835_20100 [Chloroflexota bacterium]